VSQSASKYLLQITICAGKSLHFRLVLNRHAWAAPCAAGATQARQETQHSRHADEPDSLHGDEPDSRQEDESDSRFSEAQARHLERRLQPQIESVGSPRNDSGGRGQGLIVDCGRCCCGEGCRCTRLHQSARIAAGAGRKGRRTTLSYRRRPLTALTSEELTNHFAETSLYRLLGLS
jgi:hypothetical protein